MDASDVVDVDGHSGLWRVASIRATGHEGEEDGVGALVQLCSSFGDQVGADHVPRRGDVSLCTTIEQANITMLDEGLSRNPGAFSGSIIP